MSAQRNITKHHHLRLANLILTQNTISSLRTKSPTDTDASFAAKSSIITMALSLIEKEISMLSTSLNIKLGD